MLAALFAALLALAAPRALGASDSVALECPVGFALAPVLAAGKPFCAPASALYAPACAPGLTATGAAAPLCAAAPAGATAAGFECAANF